MKNGGLKRKRKPYKKNNFAQETAGRAGTHKVGGLLTPRVETRPSVSESHN